MSNFNSQMGRGCKLVGYSAALHTEFGMQLFMRKANEDQIKILEELGTYTKGKNQGQQRGFIHWLKVVEGGFDYSIYNRGVLRGGSIEYRVTKEYGNIHDKCEYSLGGQSIKDQYAEVIVKIDEEIQSLESEISSIDTQLQRAKDKRGNWGNKSEADLQMYIDDCMDLIGVFSRKVGRLQQSKEEYKQK
jgi:hypothetical protein